MKILVVDADTTSAERLCGALRQDGCIVDIAASASEGLLCARIGSYDAILLEAALPDAPGLDVVRAMRDESDATPILLLSERRDTDALAEALETGADDYLVRPFDVRELRARVRALVRRGGARRPETLVVGALIIDRSNRTVMLGAEPLRLTPKEHQLLEYLALRVGIVVSRSELLDRVWEMHFDPHSNIVDAHVARLRSKLAVNPAAPQIDTVRGFGFRLTA